MATSGIDMVEYGKLINKVDQLEASVERMAGQIDNLVALVNQGRGAFWVAVLVGGAISSVVTFVATKLQVVQGLIK